MTRSSCPSCGRGHEVHSGLGTTEAPAPGSISICWGCREPAVFTDAGGLRAPTETERAEILAAPEFRAALAAITESFTPKQAVDLIRGQS